jgi:hypothetical protein
MIGARSRYLAFSVCRHQSEKSWGIAALLWGLWQACSRHAERSETLPQ